MKSGTIDEIRDDVFEVCIDVSDLEDKEAKEVSKRLSDEVDFVSGDHIEIKDKNLGPVGEKKSVCALFVDANDDMRFGRYVSDLDELVYGDNDLSDGVRDSIESFWEKLKDINRYY